MAISKSATDQMLDIPIRDIITSSDTQARVMLRDATIREYAELIADGVGFPAITVFTDGSSYWLADGFHRHAAHKQAGKEIISAIVKLGSKRDALIFACQANGKHGLPMTTADKRRAVELLLNDPEIAETLRDKDDDTWTQRKIARHCGVSHTFVANLIREREQHGNVATHAKTIEAPRVAPGQFVDEVLDHADAPAQPQPQVNVTTFNTPRYTSSSSGLSRGARSEVAPVSFNHAPRPAPHIPPMMTVIITWSYADADGQTVEGEIGIREIDQLPADVRSALLGALGVR